MVLCLLSFMFVVNSQVPSWLDFLQDKLCKGHHFQQFRPLDHEPFKHLDTSAMAINHSASCLKPSTGPVFGLSTLLTL